MYNPTLLWIKRERNGEREIKRERDVRDPTRTFAIGPEFISIFQPPYRPRKVPIESLRTGRHFHSVIAVDYWPESRLLKPQNLAVKPHCFAAVPLVLGEATSWILFPTIPSVLSDHPLSRELPCPGRSAVGKFMALGARSATVAARRSSPPPPSDSAWLEFSG